MNQDRGQGKKPHLRGLHIALDGMRVALSSSEVGLAYLRVSAIIFVIAAVIVGGSLWALWTHAQPAADASTWLVALSWVARVLGSLLALLVGPLLAVFVVNIVFPFFNQAVFMAGLRAIDPERAAGLEGKPGTPMGPAMGMAIVRLLKFLGLSAVCFVVGLIPVVGTVAGALGETWLAARAIAWELLDPYFDALDIRHAEQREIISRHHQVLLGFGLPISLMLAIPLVGPLLFGLVQVAGAMFVVRELPVDPREGQRVSTD